MYPERPLPVVSTTENALHRRGGVSVVMDHFPHPAGAPIEVSNAYFRLDRLPSECCGDVLGIQIVGEASRDANALVLPRDLSPKRFRQSLPRICTLSPADLFVLDPMHGRYLRPVLPCRSSRRRRLSFICAQPTYLRAVWPQASVGSSRCTASSALGRAARSRAWPCLWGPSVSDTHK